MFRLRVGGGNTEKEWSYTFLWSVESTNGEGGWVSINFVNSSFLAIFVKILKATTFKKCWIFSYFPKFDEKRS